MFLNGWDHGESFEMNEVGLEVKSYIIMLNFLDYMRMNRYKKKNELIKGVLKAIELIQEGL